MEETKEKNTYQHYPVPSPAQTLRKQTVSHTPSHQQHQRSRTGIESHRIRLLGMMVKAGECPQIHRPSTQLKRLALIRVTHELIRIGRVQHSDEHPVYSIVRNSPVQASSKEREEPRTLRIRAEFTKFGLYLLALSQNGAFLHQILQPVLTYVHSRIVRAYVRRPFLPILGIGRELDAHDVRFGCDDG